MGNSLAGCRKTKNADGRKTSKDKKIYFSFHCQTLFVNSSLFISVLFIPSEASILSTTNWEKENKIERETKIFN